MKKKLVAIMMTMAMAATVATGCGKTDDSAATGQDASTQAVQVEATTAATVAENVEAQVNADGELVQNEIVMGRRNPKTSVPNALETGAAITTAGSLNAEKKYFDFLGDKYLDDSWHNESYAGTQFYADPFLALNAGIIDRMGASIADYTETETEMAKVYKGMETVENEINEDYIAIAFCDLAGFNGVNFTTDTSVKDAVTRDAVCGMGAMFERNDQFTTGTYLDPNAEGYEATTDYFDAPATGHDVNYAFAVALGLDTANAHDALLEAGYSVLDESQTTVALIDYDKVVLANAKVFAAAVSQTNPNPAAAESQTTPAAEESQTTPATEESQPTPATEESQPTQTSQPTETPQPTENTQSSADVVPVEEPQPTQASTGTYHYNHPEAATMTLEEIDAHLQLVINYETMTYHYPPDYYLWEEDLETRAQELYDKGELR